MSKGFNEFRVVRVIGTLVFTIGAVVLFFAKILDFIVVFADKAVQLAVVRYSNFTGKLALQSFKEDQELWNIINSVNQNVLPIAEVLMPLLFFLAIFIMLIGVCIVSFPRYFADLFTTLKVLKRGKSCLEDESAFENAVPETLFKVILKWLISLFVLIVLFLSMFLVYRCSTDESSDNLKKEAEIMEQASIFIEKQKDYFNKNNTVGTLKQLNLELKDSEYFIYTISKGGSRWTVKNKEDWGKCPAGNEWKISVTTTGFFEQKISIYRMLPKNTHCADWTPNFKDVGKSLPKSEKK